MAIVSLSLRNLKGEIWKDIDGYEGLYSVSNKGRVKSHSHLVKRGWATCYTKDQILKPQTNGNYYKVGLLCGGRKATKQIFIHRLVAKAFIPNPNQLAQIDHIDGNKANNCVENLRWCTQTQNINNPNTKYKSKRLRKVAVYSHQGELIDEYASLTEAAKATGVPISSLCCIIRGINGMTGAKYKLYFKYI